MRFPSHMGRSRLSLMMFNQDDLEDDDPIMALFTDSEQGAYYDIQDTSTMFQDAAGTTPAVVGQPVGLVLDKRLGLARGAELIADPEFSSGSGWVAEAGWTISGGSAVAAGGGRLYSGLIAPINGVYEIRMVVSSVSSPGTVYIGNSGSYAKSFSTPGTYVFLLFNGGSNERIYVNAGFVGTIDSFSLKRVDGNHATQNTTASKPILSARKNLLVKSEDLTDAVWTKSAATVSANAAIAPDGTLTADKLVEDTSASAHRILATGANAVSLLAGQVVTYSVYVRAAGSTHAYVRVNNTGGDLVAGTVRLSDGVVTQTLFGTITTEADGDYWRISATGTSAAAAATSVELRTANADTYANYAGNTANGIFVWGQQLEAGPTAGRYQRVNTATDYDSTGFPLFLHFDGFDDFLSTGSIDFTSTDAVTVFAGVRKLSEAAGAGVVAELSASATANNGAFALLAPPAAGNVNATFFSRGTANSGANQAMGAAPVTAVLTAFGDISSDISTVRVNGAAGPNSATDQGTGNYGNYPLYFGRRAGTSLPFNGYEYGMVILGRTATAGEITAVENAINDYTEAF